MESARFIGGRAFFASKTVEGSCKSKFVHASRASGSSINISDLRLNMSFLGQASVSISQLNMYSQEGRSKGGRRSKLDFQSFHVSLSLKSLTLMENHASNFLINLLYLCRIITIATLSPCNWETFSFFMLIRVKDSAKIVRSFAQFWACSV